MKMFSLYRLVLVGGLVIAGAGCDSSQTDQPPATAEDSAPARGSTVTATDGATVSLAPSPAQPTPPSFLDRYDFVGLVPVAPAQGSVVAIIVDEQTRETHLKAAGETINDVRVREVQTDPPGLVLQRGEEIGRLTLGRLPEAVAGVPGVATPAVAGAAQKFESRYDDGTLKETGFKNDEGQRVGEWTRYYRSGQAQTIIPFDNGKVDGDILIYYETGQLRATEPWIQGKKHGTMTQWWPNGQIKWQGHYEDGKSHGEMISYDENGQVVKKFPWQDGKQHGEFTEYDARGNVIKQGVYEEGKHVSGDRFHQPE